MTGFDYSRFERRIFGGFSENFSKTFAGNSLYFARVEGRRGNGHDHRDFNAKNGVDVSTGMSPPTIITKSGALNHEEDANRNHD
jgi:hypothetical protein